MIAHATPMSGKATKSPQHVSSDTKTKTVATRPKSAIFPF